MLRAGTTWPVLALLPNPVTPQKSTWAYPRYLQLFGRARLAALLVPLAQSPVVVGHLFGVARRNSLSGPAADVARLLLFDLPPQLQFQLLQLRQELSTNSIHQFRIARELTGIQTLHVANHLLNFLLHFRRFAGGAAQFAQRPHALLPRTVSATGHSGEIARAVVGCVTAFAQAALSIELLSAVAAHLVAAALTSALALLTTLLALALTLTLTLLPLLTWLLSLPLALTRLLSGLLTCLLYTSPSPRD